MGLQESSMDDLFIRYLSQLTKEYPYIQLNTDNSSTTISLGYEYADKKEDVSHRKFLPFEKYPIQIHFQKVQTHFSVDSTICTITNPAEILLETKTKLKVSDTIPPDLLSSYHTRLKLYSNTELSNFLATHKRVVLEFLPNDSSQGNELDFVVSVMLSTTNRYNSSRDFHFMASGRTKIGKCFKTCAEQLWWFLTKEKIFDIFILRKDTKNNSTICEIINKDFQEK